MQSVEILEQYKSYLIRERSASENTLASYMRDLRQLQEYLVSETEVELLNVTSDDLQQYLDVLRTAGKSVSTLARNVASWKNFYQYLIQHVCITVC